MTRNDAKIYEVKISLSIDFDEHASEEVVCAVKKLIASHMHKVTSEAMLLGSNDEAIKSVSRKLEVIHSC